MQTDTAYRPSEATEIKVFYWEVLLCFLLQLISSATSVQISHSQNILSDNSNNVFPPKNNQEQILDCVFTDEDWRWHWTLLHDLKWFIHFSINTLPLQWNSINLIKLFSLSVENAVMKMGYSCFGIVKLVTLSGKRFKQFQRFAAVNLSWIMSSCNSLILKVFFFEERDILFMYLNFRQMVRTNNLHFPTLKKVHVNK